MHVTWKKGKVILNVTMEDGNTMQLEMAPEYAVGTAQALHIGAQQAWTGAATVPTVPVREEKEEVCGDLETN